MCYRNFNSWINSYKDNIYSYDYYVDFDKIYKQIINMKLELSLLNSLVGSKNIEEDFKQVIDSYPKVIQVIPLLMAVLSNEINILDRDNSYRFNFHTKNYSLNDYIKFMRDTRLFDLFENHIISNIYDYTLGVCVGLNTISRKNRSGYLMNQIVDKHIENAGFILNLNWFKELSIEEMETKFKVDLSFLSINKYIRFDYVLRKNSKIYLIETNYFNNVGSKFSEIINRNMDISKKCEKSNNINFIWIVDGFCLKSNERKLEIAFKEMKFLYNLSDLENGVLSML